LPRSPDAAGLFDRDAQVGFAPCDTNGNEIVILAAWFAGTTVTVRLLDDRFHRLQTPAARLVLQVSNAHKPFAVTGGEFLGTQNGAERLAERPLGRGAFFPARR